MGTLIAVALIFASYYTGRAVQWHRDADRAMGPRPVKPKRKS
jgi:hypothetical protein